MKIKNNGNPLPRNDNSVKSQFRDNSFNSTLLAQHLQNVIDDFNKFYSIPT